MCSVREQCDTVLKQGKKDRIKMSVRDGELNQSSYAPRTPPIEGNGGQPIELAELEQRSIPPIYENVTIITVQPHSEDHPSRRPVPVSTMDWVTTPRCLLSALSGMDFLVGVEQLEIQLIVDLSTLLGKTDKTNQYRVKVPKAETILLAMESQEPNTKKLLGYFSGFVLNVIDQSGETAFTITKNAGWRYLPGPLHKVIVETSRTIIGTVEQNFTLFGHSFTVYDDSRRPLCYIYGPNMCSWCMYKEAQFQVVSVDGSQQVASVIHQWDKTVADYLFLLTFPIDTDLRLKSLLLGATFLLEYLFFRRIRT